MYFRSIIMPLALASVSLATPTAMWPAWKGHSADVPSSAPGPAKFCLSDADAQTIVDGFVNMLEYTMADFNLTLANALLADDFTDYSDSINYLKQSPLGAVSFASKQDFIAGQGTQPPFPSVDTLNMFHTCTSIAWRWQGNYEPLPIRGVNIFLVNQKKQIQTVYVEMNSGAFLQNVGKPECNASIAYYN